MPTFRARFIALALVPFGAAAADGALDETLGDQALVAFLGGDGGGHHGLHLPPCAFITSMSRSHVVARFRQRPDLQLHDRFESP